MAKRKDQELTTEDAPDSIPSWQMLEDEEIVSVSARLHERLPDRPLTAFARRTDNGQCACFDKGTDGKGKTVVVVDIFSGAEIKQYASFGAWFDTATAR